MTKHPFHPPLPGDFAHVLEAWFSAHMRPLPWRETYDPYSVWISEIMLQQTQMQRGVRYFLAWMERFPDIAAVARADETAILSAWEGLGYYSRARNLHAAAKAIMDRHGGEFPRDIADIRALPGIGEYTAGAIASIAFNQPEPAVDANVLRIFARLCDIDQPTAGTTVKRFITETVRSLIPAESPRVFCQALMELGALVCAKNPRCGACPVQSMCRALKNGTIADRPAGRQPTRYSDKETVCAFIVHNGRVALRQRPVDGLWGGLWELPGGEVAPGDDPAETLRRLVREETGMDIRVDSHLATVKHGYTTVRVTLHCYACSLRDLPAKPVEWRPLDSLSTLAFPAGQRKLFELLGHKAAE